MEGGCFYADRRGKTPEDALWSGTQNFSYGLNFWHIWFAPDIRSVNPMYKEWTFYGVRFAAYNA